MRTVFICRCTLPPSTQVCRLLSPWSSVSMPSNTHNARVSTDSHQGTRTSLQPPQLLLPELGCWEEDKERESTAGVVCVLAGASLASSTGTVYFPPPWHPPATQRRDASSGREGGHLSLTGVEQTHSTPCHGVQGRGQGDGREE